MEMLLTSAASASQGVGQGAPPWGRSIGPVLASRIGAWSPGARKRTDSCSWRTLTCVKQFVYKETMDATLGSDFPDPSRHRVAPLRVMFKLRARGRRWKRRPGGVGRSVGPARL